MKKITTLLILTLLNSLLVSAQEHSFEEARELIESKVPCSRLNDDQLEAIGDYYMEQIHPGEAHKIMDIMIGGEGSESLKQVHINMARSFYCGEKKCHVSRYDEYDDE